MERSHRIAIVGLAIVALAGCNAVLGLEPVSSAGDDEPDAATAIDGAPGDGAPGDGAATPDADPDGGSDNDIDNDGVLDAIDNCVTVANPHQDDDDDDGTGDVCDPCPQTASATDDVDGDGVGDSCGDPSTASAQCIVWFDGFRYPRTALRYASGSGHGAWSRTATPGAVTQTDPEINEGLLVVGDTSVGASLVVSHAAVTGLATLATGETHELGTVTQLTDIETARPLATNGLLMQGASETLASVAVRRWMSPLVNLTSTEPALRAIAIDRWFAIAVDTRSSGGSFARLRYDDMPLVTLSAMIPPSASVSATGRAGLRTHRVAARFDYLLVIVDRVTATCPPRTEP